MRSERLALLVALAALAAGCSAPETEDPTPRPREVTRPPTGTARDPADLRLVSLSVVPNETEAGSTVEVVARVSNAGASHGTAEVLFEIVGGASATQSAGVDALGSADVRAHLTPTTGGALAVRATLGAQEAFAQLVVRAPRIADVRLEAGAGEPCAPVPLAVSFMNAGDAPARNARAELAVTDAAGAPVVSLERPIGDVAPGERGAVTIELDEVPAACEGAEPEFYGARLLIHVDAIPSGQLTGVFQA